MRKSIKLSLVTGAILASSSFFVGCSSDGSVASSSLAGAAGGGKSAPFLMLTTDKATATDAAGTVLESTDALNTVLAGNNVHFEKTMSSDYNVTIPGSMVVDVDNSGDYNSSVDKFISQFGFSQLNGVGGGEINVGTTIALAKLADNPNDADANALLNYYKTYDVTKTVKSADLNATDAATKTEAKIKEQARKFIDTVVETMKYKKSQSVLKDVAVGTNFKTALTSAAEGNFTAAAETASDAAETAGENDADKVSSTILLPTEQTAIKNVVTAKTKKLNILRDLEASGQLTEANYIEATLGVRDTDSNITAIIAGLANSADINTTEVDADITTVTNDEVAATNTADALIASQGPTLKLAKPTLTFGSETVTLNAAYTSFTKTINVTNDSTVANYYDITIPVDKTQIDKTATDSSVTLAVQITEIGNSAHFASFTINGAELVTTTDENRSKRTLALNFNTNTRITVASSMPELTTVLGASSVTSEINDMTNTDFAFNMTTVLNKLSTESTKINNAVTALNKYLTQTRGYTVDLGFDANVTTDFADHNFTSTSALTRVLNLPATPTYKGVGGTINVNNPNYNKAPVKLGEIMNMGASEKGTFDSSTEAHKITDFVNDTEALTFTTTSTLPAGLTFSSNGVLSGTLTSSVSADTNTSITVKATDSARQSVESTFIFTTYNVSAPSAPTLSDQSFVVGVAKSVDFSSVFMGYNLTYSISGCTLPTGILFDSNGTMHGTATVADTDATACSVTATDSIAQTVDSNSFAVTSATDPLAGLTTATGSESSFAVNAGGASKTIYYDFTDSTIVTGTANSPTNEKGIQFNADGTTQLVTVNISYTQPPTAVTILPVDTGVTGKTFKVDFGGGVIGSYTILSTHFTN